MEPGRQGEIVARTGLATLNYLGDHQVQQEASPSWYNRGQPWQVKWRPALLGTAEAISKVAGRGQPFQVMQRPSLPEKALARLKVQESPTLKVHKREKFFSSDFECFSILYLVKLKY